MKLRYFTIAAAAIAFAACTDDLGLGGFANDSNAVRIRATVGEPLARSNPAGDETTVTQFNEGDKIFVSTDAQPNGIVYQLGSEGWKPEGTEYLIWSNTKHTFTAYYPDTYKGSGNVPADQGDLDKIAAADYMKFEGELPMQKTVSFTMKRQTARVIINDLRWGDEYKDNSTNPATITHQLTSFSIHCNGVADMTPYKQVQDGNTRYYVLVNAQAAQSEAPFLTLTIAPKQEGGTPITHTVKGIPAFQPGYSYTYNVTIGKNGVTLSDVVVDDWSTGRILPGEGSADDNVEPYFHISKPDESDRSYTYAGGSKEYTVSSYVTNGKGEQIGMPWTAKFVRKLQDGTYEEIKQDEADYPTWISGFIDKGDGSEPHRKITITVAPTNISNKHCDVLKNNPPVNGIYNLANATGEAPVVNTANCYIVNAAGTYSFPLVYGNAIKEGDDNASAYTGVVGSNYALETFVNHNNDPITSPYIAEHAGCTPADATLVWQDADQLVSNIRFVDGGSPDAHRIIFDVAKSTIKQGNAIIAVRNAENTILWSWHIWVTDYKPGLTPAIMTKYDPTETQRDRTIYSYDNEHTFTIMGVPMGWCDAESAAGRETIIQYTQIETGDTEELTIVQESLSAGGNYVYYQWGRKDPMLGSNGFDNTDKPHFNNGYPFTKDGPGKATIGKAIQNPHVFYNWGGEYHSEWCDNSGTAAGRVFLYNLWDATKASASTTEIKYTLPVKTVYDPSPVGYIVPPNGAMNGMTYDAKNSLKEWSKFNTPFKTMDEFFANKGMVFYCRGMNGNKSGWDASGGLIYYPAAGRRFENGYLYQIGEAANYWTATPHDAARMWMSGFSFTNNEPGVGAMTYYGTVYGEALRPVRE